MAKRKGTIVSARTQKEIREHRKEVILRHLIEYGESIRLTDLVELTREEIEWPKQGGGGPTTLMNRVMEETPEIQRTRPGYYKYVPIKLPKKPIVKEEPKKEPTQASVDERILEPAPEDKVLLEGFQTVVQPVVKAPSTPPIRFRVGDEFEGTVNRIEGYGVFVNHSSGWHGLIHHKCMIKGKSVLDPHQHFKVGDKVKCKVIMSKGAMKLSLSTEGYELPDYFAATEHIETVRNNTLAEKLAQAKEVFKKTEPVTVTEPKVEPPKEKNPLSISVRDEFKDITEHLQTIVGPISPEANEKLAEILQDKGIVKFMLAMVEAQKDFTVDMGLIFLKSVETQMGNRP